jgi:hypothetical protein
MIMADPERKTHPIVGVPSHPLPSGHVFQSPGSQFSYRVIGPCCRLQWRGKEPSWRRMGKRLIVDISTKRYPSYNVELIGYPKPMKPLILTLYTERLSAVDQEWWHSKKMQKISP